MGISIIFLCMAFKKCFTGVEKIVSKVFQSTFNKILQCVKRVLRVLPGTIKVVSNNISYGTACLVTSSMLCPVTCLMFGSSGDMSHGSACLSTCPMLWHVP